MSFSRKDIKVILVKVVTLILLAMLLPMPVSCRWSWRLWGSVHADLRDPGERR